MFVSHCWQSMAESVKSVEPTLRLESPSQLFGQERRILSLMGESVVVDGMDAWHAVGQHHMSFEISGWRPEMRFHLEMHKNASRDDNPRKSGMSISRFIPGIQAPR